MIAHRTFTEQTIGLTGQGALGKREKLREEAEEFITSELHEGDVISIAETAIAVGGLFSVTVWYRRREVS